MAECNLKAGHYINLSGTSILDRTPGLVIRLIKEAVERELNISNFNRGSGFVSNHSWCPVTNVLIKKQYAV
jgi:hypothetical protein